MSRYLISRYPCSCWLAVLCCRNFYNLILRTSQSYAESGTGLFVDGCGEKARNVTAEVGLLASTSANGECLSTLLQYLSHLLQVAVPQTGLLQFWFVIKCIFSQKMTIFLELRLFFVYQQFVINKFAIIVSF